MRSWACLAALETTLLTGAAIAPWRDKQFNDWTPADARLIMRKSPWAKSTPMPAGGRSGLTVLENGDSDAPPPSAALGNPSNTTTGANMSVAGNPGSAGPADPSGTHELPTSQASSSAAPAAAPYPESGLTVIWASATPVRLAVLKLRSGASTPAQADVDRAIKPTRDYVIAVVGLPAPGAGSDAGALKNTAFLSLHGKTPLMAISSDYRKIGNADVYFFHFSKNALPVTVNDRQVEFRMTFGRMEVRKRFDLGEMQYQGQLAL
jgi:hypothetical protein